MERSLLIIGVVSEHNIGIVIVACVIYVCVLAAI